jgi:hypothetical protein
MGAMVLSVPTSTTFKYASSTQTVGNASTSGAWTKIPPVFVAGSKDTTIVSSIAIANRSPINLSYSIYAGGVALAENTAIPGGTTQYIDLEQMLFNGDKLILCATNKDVIFHVSGKDI